MGTFTVQQWDTREGMRKQWKGLLVAPATFGICVFRIPRDDFVPTRTVDPCLPSKNPEWNVNVRIPERKNAFCTSACFFPRNIYFKASL